MTASETATFGGGCFWCIEAAFEELDGVVDVTSGYAGGDVEDPTYEAVCAGETGHAEVVQVEYDPDVVTYDDLLEVFFTIHDPTQVNRQGPDIGSQYRSIVLTHDENQRKRVEAYIEALDEEYADDVATEVEALDTFYRAEEYHQNYFAKSLTADGNTNDAYCARNVQPKVEKVREKFEQKVESESA